MNDSRLDSRLDKSEGEYPSQYCSYLFNVLHPHDDYAPYVVNVVVNIPTSILTICGNILVMLSIWNTPTLHSPSHVLLFSLAMADFGVGLLVQPSFIVFLFAKIYSRFRLFCASAWFVTIAANFLCGVSLLTLTAISLDRILAVRLLARYRSIVKAKRVIYLVMSIWFYNALLAVTPIPVEEMDAQFYIPAISASVCSSLMLFCYASIFRSVRRQQRLIWSQQTQQQQQLQMRGLNSANLLQVKKLCIALFLICCLFLFCNMPFVCVTMQIVQVGFSYRMGIAFDFSATVVFLGSCLNPVVFCWRLPDIRRACRRTLRKCCSFRGHADSALTS